MKTRSTIRPAPLKHVGRAFGGDDFEAEIDVAAGQLDGCLLVVVVDGEEDGAAGGQNLAGGELRLGEGFAEGGGHAHHFAGGLHLRAENRIDAGKLGPGEDRRFDVVVRAGSEILARWRARRAAVRAACGRS